MVLRRRFFLPPLRRVSVVALEPLEIDCSIPLSPTAYVSLNILEISDRPIDGSLVIKPYPLVAAVSEEPCKVRLAPLRASAEAASWRP